MFNMKFAKPVADKPASSKYPDCIDPSFVGAKVLYEDDVCVAFQEQSKPVAKVHFIVAPKSPKD